MGYSEYSQRVCLSTPMGYAAHEAPAVCAAASPCGGAPVSCTASPVGGGGAEAPAVGYSEYSQWGLRFRVLSLGGRMRAGLCVHAGAGVRGCAAAGFSARVCARSFRGVPVRVYSPAHVCARVYSAGTFRTGHVEDPKEAFRPGEAEQRNGADAQFEHLPWPCRAVRVQVGALATRRRGRSVTVLSLACG